MSITKILHIYYSHLISITKILQTYYKDIIDSYQYYKDITQMLYRHGITEILDAHHKEMTVQKENATNTKEFIVDPH